MAVTGHQRVGEAGTETRLLRVPLLPLFRECKSSTRRELERIGKQSQDGCATAAATATTTARTGNDDCQSGTNTGFM